MKSSDRSDRASTVLHLPRGARAELDRLVRAGYPLEACGVLVGRVDANGAAVEVVRAEPARNRNVDRAHDRFELDPEDYLAAENRAREDGLEVVGIWHSHPDHPARPSETDRAAAWEGWSYVIVSVDAGGVRDLRSWRLTRDHRFVEEDIRT